MQMHKELIEEQDEHLEEINQIAMRLNKAAHNVGETLDKQKETIEELNKGVDGTMQKMNFVQGKLSELLHTKDPGQICTIIILSIILVVLIFLVIYT